MANEAAQLWIVTEIEMTETKEVVRGGRGSDNIGGTSARREGLSRSKP